MREDIDLAYLRTSLEIAQFRPYPWEGEDRNMLAFRSKNEFIDWYCQPPGVVAQPYRDRGFYTRELAMLSMVIRPKTVVEFGTSLGLGCCLLHWLNPTARLVTVDINTDTFMPGGPGVEIGHLSRWQGIPCEYVTGNSWDYNAEDVDLCFIDGDHSFNAVQKDSIRAWVNVSHHRPWAIAWHDHNERHPGVMDAVAEFCKEAGYKLQSRPDSDTVWITGVQ